MNEQNKKIPKNPLAFLLRNEQIKVTPGNGEKDCLAFRPGNACACDECRYYQTCQPNIDSQKGETNEKTVVRS